MNRKIVLSVGIAFLLSFSFLYLFLKSSDSGGMLTPIEEQEKFYLQDFPSDKKKIFILGTSHVMPLNSTYIQEKLTDEKKDYLVYNLSIGTSEPKDRIKTLDLILAAEPEIIVYGIAERDFRTNVKLDTDKTNIQSLLPDPQTFFHSILWQFAYQEFTLFENPKFVTLTTIYELISNDSETNDVKKIEKDQGISNMPFYEIAKEHREIRTFEYLQNEMQKQRVGSFQEINLPYQNPDLISLKEMIKTFEDNDIKVIIFTTPHHEIYREKTPEKTNERFQLILDEIVSEFDLEIYSLLDKYSDMEVWGDVTHLAVNPNAIIYSEDIANKIMEIID